MSGFYIAAICVLVVGAAIDGLLWFGDQKSGSIDDWSDVVAMVFYTLIAAVVALVLAAFGFFS